MISEAGNCYLGMIWWAHICPRIVILGAENCSLRVILRAHNFYIRISKKEDIIYSFPPPPLRGKEEKSAKKREKCRKGEKKRQKGAKMSKIPKYTKCGKMAQNASKCISIEVYGEFNIGVYGRMYLISCFRAIL